MSNYHVHHTGTGTVITECPTGEWTRWAMARAAAIAHLRKELRMCREAIRVLRRAASYREYISLREETSASKDRNTDEKSQVPVGDTLK